MIEPSSLAEGCDKNRTIEFCQQLVFGRTSFIIEGCIALAALVIGAVSILTNLVCAAYIQTESKNTPIQRL